MSPSFLRGLRLWGAAVLLATLGRGGWAADSQKPINVLFIMTDQHHYSALGSAGNRLIKTPHLDKLAAEGTRFSHMYCPVPYCSPSRASIVTGRYPSSLGLGRNIDRRDDPLRLHDPIDTYLHHLAVKGYRCHQLGKWHLGEPSEMNCFCDPAGDLQGANKMVRERLRAAGAAAFDPGPRSGEGLLVHDVYLRGDLVEPYQRIHELMGGKNLRGQDLGLIGRYRVKPQFHYEWALADYCVELLKRHRNEPFAITYSVSPPHPLNVVPAPYYDMYDPAKMPLPDNWTDQPALQARTNSAIMGRIYGEAGVREYVRCYYGQVTMMDECIGRILKALADLGLADRTLVIFTTDHGDFLGQHHMVDKGCTTFYEDLIHIPLLMRLPGRIPAGKMCAAVSASIDLAPTILDYTSAEPLAKAHGRSLRPYVEGAEDAARPIFCEREKLDSPKPASRMIRTPQWKLCVLASGDVELYDEVRDPGEVRNLAADPARAGVIRDLALKLRHHMREVGDQGLPKLDARLAELGSKP